MEKMVQSLYNPLNNIPPNLDSVEEASKNLLETIFPNYKDNPNLQDTPKRLAKMLCQELFVGCFSEPPKITMFPNDRDYDQLIVIPQITFSSMCAHHFLPFYGEVTVGILNKDKQFAGLSKYHRIVDWFARRPQVQENLTQEIADHLMEKLDPYGVGVFIKATHLCTVVRGVKQPRSHMITTALKGSFKKSDVKEEFLRVCDV